ncbi:MULTISPECIES: site-2 protease family protein [Sporomusaceae]|uniref:site-2 protease family protein n=1 Tax=Sporomusaceae TaxID=1843490 RepID=UPI000362A6F6|nr:MULTISPECIES: site-2 protease family protein [Sporomusaceae]
MFSLDADLIFRVPALLIALTVHEYAHARAAVAMGDDTPRQLGRVTLNPLAHLDPVGLLMLWLTQFGWAKPVPVNPNRFHSYRSGMIWVSLAGPLSNALMALVAAISLGACKVWGIGIPEVWKVLAWTRDYNIILAIFNLLPIPPLDGSKVISVFLPWKYAELYERIIPYSPVVLIALVYIGVIGTIVYPFQIALYLAIQTIVGILFF